MLQIKFDLRVEALYSTLIQFENIKISFFFAVQLWSMPIAFYTREKQFFLCESDSHLSINLYIFSFTFIMYDSKRFLINVRLLNELISYIILFTLF